MLKKRIYRIALLSSPVLAMYGILPIFLLTEQPLFFLLGACSFLTLLFGMFWIINVFLLDWYQDQHWKRYLLSYVLTFLLHLLIVSLAPKSFDLAHNPISITYPPFFILIVNTIILIICAFVRLQYEKGLSDLEAQKQMLQQQLQPHFLFNALSTLKSLIQEDPEAAENYTVELSEFLRYSIQAKVSELVPLEDELKFTRDYLNLQGKRFHEALRCTIDIPPTMRHMKIPVYALQTLVENAIKHNHFTEEEPLVINIDVVDQRIRVWNNRQTNRDVPTSGLGLSNLNKRYEIITHKRVEIVETDQDFCVYIPLIASS